MPPVTQLPLGYPYVDIANPFKTGIILFFETYMTPAGSFEAPASISCKVKAQSFEIVQN